MKTHSKNMNRAKSEYQATVNRLTRRSLSINILLALIQMLLGTLTLSISLISDSIHTLSDALTDIVAWLGVRLGNRPPDSDHHYGHGKYETFAELILSLFILSAAGSIIAYALSVIINGQSTEFHWQVILGATVAIVCKEYLFRITVSESNKYNSQVLLANAWHHRSDTLSSVVVLAGAIFAFFGAPYADAIAGILVGLLVAMLGIKFFRRGLMELSESTPGKELERKVLDLLDEMPEVKSFHKVRLRKLGSQLYMDMHIMVDSDLSLKEAHDISTRAEFRIRKELGYETTNVLIHVEPETEVHVDL